MQDVIVVGNGALGCSVAYELAKSDGSLDVTLVGPSSRHHGGTATAGAMITAWAELSLGQLEDPALRVRAEMAMGALETWDELCSELSEYTDARIGVDWGTYVIANVLSSPHEQATLEYIVEAMRERGVRHRDVDPSEVPGFKPMPEGRATRVVWLPDGRIDARTLLSAYDRALDARGVARIDDEAVRLEVGPRGDGDKRVALSDGRVLTAKHVVLANGSFAQKLVDQVPSLRAEVPPLLWGVGWAFDLWNAPQANNYGGADGSLDTADAVIRTLDRGGACGVHLIPQGDHRFYLGASSDVWTVPESGPRVQALQILTRSMVQEVHKDLYWCDARVRGPGIRPTTADCFPLLGESHVPGVWFANGTKRDGLTCAPYIGANLARAMLTGEHGLPALFRPSRNLISYKTQNEAIEDTVAAHFGMEVQEGLRLPPYGEARYRKAKRDRFAAAYDKRGIEGFGIHPEVMHLYEDDAAFAALDHARDHV